MNPADVAQSALPVTADLSIFSLFLQAHWVVKLVMIGLLACSIWVWAIAIDKLLLFARTKRAMDRFEQAFWSGQSLEELYRALSAKPTHSMAALFVADMREWKRSFEGHARSFAGLQTRIDKVMDVTITREIDRLERRLLVLATVGSAGPFVGLRTFPVLLFLASPPTFRGALDLPSRSHSAKPCRALTPGRRDSRSSPC
jgi:biopolymer transport protein TolQ